MVPLSYYLVLSGILFTCGVLGNGSSARVLPIVGMNFASLPAGALPQPLSED